MGGLVKDSAGNFYGTTSLGGNGGCTGQGCGAVFKLNSDLSETGLFSFDSTNGKGPDAGLVWNSAHTTLYGTTEYGGTKDVGVVFKITP